MSTEQKYVDKFKELKSGFEQLGNGFDQAMDGLEDQVRDMLSEEDFVKWKELFGRLMSANLEKNTEMVKGIEQDIKDIFSKYEKPEKE